MDNEKTVHEKIAALEDIYQNYDIYRAVLIYDDEDEFTQMLDTLQEKEYPIAKADDTDPGIRMFGVKMGNDTFYLNIPWEQVNMIISMAPSCDAYAREVFYSECMGHEKINIVYI